MTTFVATQPDLNVAALLIGAFFGSVGLGLVWFGRSLWAERQAQRAERITTETPSARRQRLAEFEKFMDECDQSLAIAAHALRPERLSPVADVVPFPTQRIGGESS